MSNRISTLLPQVQQQAPASEQVLEMLVHQLHLPQDYIDVLRTSNGLEGWIDKEHYIMLWRAESLVENNQGYAIEEFAPGCFLIGSDGADLSYGLDLRLTSSTYESYLSRPFISYEWEEVVILGRTFEEFIAAAKQGAS